MKVAITYSDGDYHMYDPLAHTFAAGVDPAAWMAANTVEISADDWKEYQAFLATSRYWYQRLQALDNLIYERKQGGANEQTNEDAAPDSGADRSG